MLDTPLSQRVLDPACGSGTFLFHAVRRVMQAATEAGWSQNRTLEACGEQVRGLDVHPVAVIIARVTWLLALGSTIHSRKKDLHVPVCLGDALQWNVPRLGNQAYIEVPVPDERPRRVPAGFAEDQAKYDPGLKALVEGLEDDASSAEIKRRLLRIEGVDDADASAITDTFDRLRNLRQDGRNHIWPFVMRNIVRPLWLSRPDQRADVVLGNPPWVAYRHLSAEMKTNLRDASIARNLWVGGILSTQQDLSALFWAKKPKRTLSRTERPHSCCPTPLSTARLSADCDAATTGPSLSRIVEAWSFDESVQPLFPVPASVLIARREVAVPWPPIPTLVGASPYRARFRQGATIVPRRFFFVEREVAGRLGQNPNAPRVRGKTGTLDKAPWKTVEPPRGPVEAQFIRPVILGKAKTRLTLVQQIDHMRKLSSQLPTSPTRVVYAASGIQPAAAVVQDAAPLVEHSCYCAPARSHQEARYLVAILNSETIASRINRLVSQLLQPAGLDIVGT